MYEKCDVEKMLRSYLLSNSKLEELENKIAKNKVLLKYNEKKFKESAEEAIEGMSLNSPVISDIPKRKNK